MSSASADEILQAVRQMPARERLLLAERLLHDLALDVAVDMQAPRPRFGSARGLVHMNDDFDATLADFAEYLG